MNRAQVIIRALTLVVLAAVLPVSPATAQSGAVLVAGEPYMLANTDTFSIQGSNGSEERNRAAAPIDGVLRNLYLAPNLQPTAGSVIEACLRVNGVDTNICVTYTSADWPGSKGAAGSVTVTAGDLITVHFTETNGVASGSNVRATLSFD